MFPTLPIIRASDSQDETNPLISSSQHSNEKKSIPENSDFQVRIKTADFYCPILHTVMKEPLSLECGHNFEERAIKEWFKKNKNRLCPLCNQNSPATTKNLFLKNAIEEWKKQHRSNKNRKKRILSF